MLPTTLQELKYLETRNLLQSNPLIEAVFLQPFKEIELKVLCLISKYINENNFLHIENDNVVEGLQNNFGNCLKIVIPKADFCSFVRSNPSNFYQQIETLSKELISKSVLIESMQKLRSSKAKKKFIAVTLFGGIGCESAHAIFFINPILRLYLQHLKSNFTVLSLEHIANMNSLYAIKIYQLLKQYESAGKREFLLEELKKILGISGLYTENFKDFRKKVLEVAKENINNSSDIEIDFAAEKDGNKVARIVFKISAQQTHLQQAARSFKRHVDAYLLRNAPFNLDLEHRAMTKHWDESKKDIEQNQKLFDTWIKNNTSSYKASSTRKLEIFPIYEFGIPQWYKNFLSENKHS
jgi:plasmid replication initiation protein